jgi:regulator of RNase E activity RraA
LALWTISERIAVGRITKMKAQEPAFVSAQQLDQLRLVSTGTASSILIKEGIGPTFMSGIAPQVLPGPNTRIVGRAVTARFLPRREDVWQAMSEEERTSPPYRKAIESLEPGDVLVIDAMGWPEGAMVGDILSARIKNRGGAALVVDGPVRDLIGLKEVGLPVFAKNLHPVPSPYGIINTDANVPIQCGGVLVMPGDIVLADEDGVMIVPPALATKVAEAGIEIEEMEAFTRMKVEQGFSTLDVYPLNEELQREFEEFKKR